MYDAIGVDIYELSKTVGSVVRSHEPALDARAHPLGVQCFSVGNVEVHNSTGLVRVARLEV